MSQPNPLRELYRDDWLLAVHKPAGLLVHRSPIDKHETEFALQYARELNGGEHVYPLHRLDRPTSGVLVFARDAQTASVLGQALMAGEMQKTYLALVRGWAPEAGVIDQPLRDKAIDRRDASEQPMREALTHYRRLATAQIDVAIERYPQSRYSLLQLAPHTGRKHQLRRHMQHIAHPIIGDTNYGRTKQNHYFAQRFGSSRLMLACTGMAFSHPVTGELLSLRCAPEASFMQVLEIFGAELPDAGFLLPPDTACTLPVQPEP